MLNQFYRYRYPLSLIAMCAMAFIPFLGRTHLFDWDEINFAEISREMLVLKDYLRLHVDFEPFWQKPPLFFWMQVLAMKSFGIGEFTARLPNAICGISTILVLYHMGKQLIDSKFGLLWSLAYFGSILPHLYFKTGIIDPWFNLFIFIGLYFLILFFWKRSGEFQIRLTARKYLYLILAGLSIGLGILTKGPVAFLVISLCLGVYWIIDRFKLPISIPQFLLFTVLAAFVTLMWYGLETLKHGPWFITEFTRYQYVLFSTPSAGHAGFPGYHLVVNWIGCFPASIIAIPALFGKKLDLKHVGNFSKWMIILFWVVIILFSIVESKILHYSSLVYFPLTFLAAVTIRSVDRGDWRWHRGLTWGLAITGGIIAVAIAAVPILGKNIEMIAGYVSDPFALANMQAEVDWSSWEIVFGLGLICALGLSIWLIHTNRYRKACVLLFCSVALMMFSVSYQFIPKIERYSQGAAVDFLKTLEGEDCYVDILGYKSYAHYFYTRKQPPGDRRSYSEEWLLRGEIDKPAYFITKNDRADRYTDNPGIEVLYEKNGFVFLKRPIAPSPSSVH